MTGTPIERLKRSNAWDHRYNLPTVPIHNQPHLYMAYCIHVFGWDAINIEDHAAFLHGCSRGPIPGLFARWPGTVGGYTSFDELIGIAYMDRVAAEMVLDYLTLHDGDYNVSGEPGRPLEFNMYRFVFLTPYLKARAGFRVGAISQIAWAASTIVPQLFQREDQLSAGSLLRNWLMSKAMREYPISGAAIRAWSKRMREMGIGPRWCFERYLREVPELREFAPDHFFQEGT